MEHTVAVATSSDGYKSTAVISPCGRYRYMLGRSWDDTKIRLPFVMLNPSTADAEVDDPTIRRCIGFAKRARYGGILVANLFAIRETDSKKLASLSEQEGPENAEYLRSIIASAAEHNIPIVCAWGSRARHVDRGAAQRFLDAAKAAKVRTVCIEGPNADGTPRHPLYIRSNAPIVAYP